MRGRLIFALTLLVLSLSPEAYACLAIVRSLEKNFVDASAVFVAHVTRVEETKAILDGRDPLLESTVRVIEVFKGRPPLNRKIKSPLWRQGDCSIPLLPGNDYLFFLTTPESLVFGGDDVQLLGDLGEKKTQSLLADLRALKDKK